MNRFLWAVLTLLVFAAPGVAGAASAANTVSLTLPECRRPATVPPPRHPPAGYSLVRTDRVDWNADGWCDLTYFFAPTNPTERRHLGGYAVDFFTFTPPAGWQRVTRMTYSSGHCDYVDSHTPFPTPDSLFVGVGPSPGSHYLMGDVGWVDNLRVGVLMFSDDRFFQWHEATTGPEFSELSGENANVMSASLIVARELRTLNRLLRTPDFKTLDQLDFSTFGSSPDLRIIRVARVLCLLKGDLACLSHAAESAALHPATQWRDVGALRQTMVLQDEFNQATGQGLAEAALKKDQSHWTDRTALWQNWYRLGRHHAPNAVVPREALASIHALLGAPVPWPSADKQLAKALNDYFVLQHFMPWKQGQLPDGRGWKIGLSNGALMLQLDGHWRQLVTLPWLDYPLPSTNTGDRDCMQAFCEPSSPYPARLLPSDSLEIKGSGGSRDFTAGTPWEGYGGSHIEGSCSLREHPAYFQMDCGFGYDGGAHPDEAYDSYFFSKNPAIFGLAVPNNQDTCMGAKYDESVFDHTWNNLLASCAYEMETGKSGEPDKAHYMHWLKAGREIVGNELPFCAQVAIDPTTKKLSVFASTGTIGRQARGTSCDQAMVSVPLLNPKQYVHLQLTSRLISKILQRSDGEISRLPLGATHAERMLLDRDYADLDRKLNRQYQALLKAAPPVKRPAIVEAERAWLKQRDKVLAGEPILIKDTCAIDGCSGSRDKQEPVDNFMDERISQLKRDTERVKKQWELSQINFEGRFPKCVTPLTENQCDAPILVTWCWNTEGKLSQWQNTEMVCAKVGRITSLIEPGQELYAPMPHSNYPLSAQIKVYHSCVADDRTKTCLSH